MKFFMFDIQYLGSTKMRKILINLSTEHYATLLEGICVFICWVPGDTTLWKRIHAWLKSKILNYTTKTILLTI